MKNNIFYNSDTGELSWLKPGKGRNTNKPIGTLERHGYLVMMFKGKQYKSHRVAWFLYYGEWPKGILDHINRNKSDNRICNLREVDFSENTINARKMKGKAVDYIGVSREGNKFKASICTKGVKVYLGCFETPEDAAFAYDKAARRYHGKFAKQNFPAAFEEKK